MTFRTLIAAAMAATLAGCMVSEDRPTVVAPPTAPKTRVDDKPDQVTIQETSHRSSNTTGGSSTSSGAPSTGGSGSTGTSG